MNTTSLIFVNPGEIDIRGASIAGLSAKETDSAIGYFGTGLKYAIAQVLANGGTITIWSGLTRHEFTPAALVFRGQDHIQIMMTTEYGIDDTTTDLVTTPLGFTTGYGRKWQAWQIFRELYANALDEGGEVVRGGRDAVEPSPGSTVIVVTGWEELQEQFFKRDEIILPQNKFYTIESDQLKVADEPANFIYYKGVRVATRNCDLLWNFKSGVSLTEDRTVEAGSWEISHTICKFVTACDNEQIIRKVLTSGDNNHHSFESLALNWFTAPKSPANCSEAFANVACDLFRLDPVKYHEYEELALEHQPALRASRVVALTPLQQRILDKAKALVSKMGFEYEISHLPITVENLGGKTLGRYKDGLIYLSPLVFDQGTKQVVSTLYEECLHAKLGYKDCTYEMQTHLFNTIIGLFEELWGEPC